MELDELIETIRKMDEDDTQVLSETDAKLALRIMNLNVEDAPSALLFFAASNFLNAYVKKPYADPHFHKRYLFKNDVTRVIESLTTRSIDDVAVHLAQDVDYVRVKGLQFSFHNLEKTPILSAYRQSEHNVLQEWTGLRLQPAAKPILDYALQEAPEELKKRFEPVDPVLIFKALGDPIRFSIYQSLLGIECCACDMLEKYSITQPTLSHHMGKLVQSGLIIARKDGIWTRYSVNPIVQDQIGEWFEPVKENRRCAPKPIDIQPLNL
ncbi:MAG: metalloregulator ArsR/SmtB family transcription factor [Erysipelotrichaceae bacterium]